MKRLLSLLFVILLAVGMTGCSSSSTTEESTETTEDTPVTLVYAEVNPESTTVGQIAAAFKSKAEELSNGSITIDVQYSGVLGAEGDVLDGMLAGSDEVQIARISAFALSSYGASESTLLTLPYTFTSREHFWKFVNSEYGSEVLHEADDALPIRSLFYGEEGFRHFFTKKEITSYKDLAGMKIRVSNDAVMNGMVEALGATPTVVSFSELYSALNSGVVDAAEQPITNYESNSFPEVAPNLLLDGHTIGAIEIIISDSAWDSLSDNQKAAIEGAATYAQQVDQEIAAQAEEESLARMKEAGVNIIEVSDADKAEMQALCADLISQYTTGDLKTLYDNIVGLK